jgi:hypothetical protein
MSKSFTNTILMVRPYNFGYNTETAENNGFQSQLNISKKIIKEKAILEFDEMVDLLVQHGVDVIIVEDTPDPPKPDAVFPNNWFSTHPGRFVLYPMFAENRRIERRGDIIEQLIEHYDYQSIESYTHNEAESRMLEGTGSMILDRDHMIAYACISERTNQELFFQWCKSFGYRPEAFTAVDKNDEPIYHTNVMMALGQTFVIVCLESVGSPTDRENLLNAFVESDKVVIDITLEQMENFAGNMLQVIDQDGKPILVMSARAFSSLTETQVTTIESHTTILAPQIPTIETIGGGSVRCMMAEIFS